MKTQKLDLKVKELDFSAFWLSAVYRNTAQKSLRFVLRLGESVTSLYYIKNWPLSGEWEWGQKEGLCSEGSDRQADRGADAGRKTENHPNIHPARKRGHVRHIL